MKIVGIELFLVILCYPLDVHGICVSCDISNSCLFSFFYKRLINFTELSENWTLVLLIFLYFPVFISSISVLIFISFLLVTLDVICCLSSFLTWQLRLLVLDLSSFLKYTFSAIKFPLTTAFALSHKI